MTRNAHAAAWLTKLNPALGSLVVPAAAYEVDEAPKVGVGFVMITLTQTYGGNRRGDVLSPSGWRLTVRAVDHGVTNGYVLLDKCDDALYNQTVTVGGITSTGAQRETDEPVGEDEDKTGVWSGLRSYTYAF